MELIHDESRINGGQRKLVLAGYAEKTVHSIHFERYFSEEERTENFALAQSIGGEEWDVLCNKIAKTVHDSMWEIVNNLADRYDIHHTKPENSSLAHFGTNWDLYFWSNKGWNNKDYMTCCTLTFNELRTTKRNMALLAEIVPILENMEYKNIECRIRYAASLHHEAINEAAYQIFDGLVGKPFEYMGKTGKIKLVSECEGTKKYGFFEKGARKRYRTITATEILTMNI